MKVWKEIIELLLNHLRKNLKYKNLSKSEKWNVNTTESYSKKVQKWKFSTWIKETKLEITKQMISIVRFHTFSSNIFISSKNILKNQNQQKNKHRNKQFPVSSFKIYIFRLGKIFFVQ